MANAAAFRQVLRARLAETLGPAARSRALATVAKTTVAELVRSGRASESFRVFVDGRPDAPEESVKGDGTGAILYEFSYTGEAAAFALAYLKGRAPHKTGKFADSFFASVNGRFIPAAEFDPRRVPPNASIIIGNTQPFNRKADVQTIGADTQPGTFRKLNFNRPPRMYADAAREVGRRFGNTVGAFRLANVDFPGKYRLQNVQTRRTGSRAGRVVRGEGDFVESPGLRIVIR